MQHYSKVVKRKGRFFRYDCSGFYLQWITKSGELIDEIGLCKENWEDDEARNEYIDEWMAQEEETIAHLLRYEEVV